MTPEEIYSLAGLSPSETASSQIPQLCADEVRRGTQRARDEARISRKHDRENDRLTNALTAYAEALAEAAEIYGEQLSGYEVRRGALNPEAAIAVLHLSDLHFNELIDLPDNKFDFEVAAKRLEKLAAVSRLQCKAFGVQKIVVCLGGDLLNSDRRLDELLHMATNRARATMLSAHLLEHLIRDLRQDFFVDVLGITGNEGRAKEELGWGDVAVTDSYDAQIFMILQKLFGSEDHGLRFHPFSGNQQVFGVHDETFMLVHGHQVNCTDQKKVQALIGKMSAQSGERITHILAGHIHATAIGDYVSRNASLAGSNAYSSDALQLCSKAAQNLHIVVKDGAQAGGLYGIKVDLQRTDGFDGYPIIPELIAYNAKSVGKAYRANHDEETVVRIVI